MAVYFFDSSALAKRYVIEAGTRWVTELLDPTGGHNICVSRITGAELVAAIGRRRRAGALAPIFAASALAQFRAEFGTLFRLVEVTELLVRQAMDLADRRDLRGYDAVQLAAALEVDAGIRSTGGSSTLVSSDLELNVAASAEGLMVVDPNLHP